MGKSMFETWGLPVGCFLGALSAPGELTAGIAAGAFACWIYCCCVLRKAGD